MRFQDDEKAGGAGCMRMLVWKVLIWGASVIGCFYGLARAPDDTSKGILFFSMIGACWLCYELGRAAARDVRVEFKEDDDAGWTPRSR